MTSARIAITLPYQPTPDLTDHLFDDAEAVWGPEAEIELDVAPTERGLETVEPLVLIVTTYLGGHALDLVTEASFKAVGARLRRLFARLRHGDKAKDEPGYTVLVEGIGPTRAIFHIDAAAMADHERAFAEMVRLDATDLPPATHLTWDATISSWRRVL
jgi:hypothetical protein